MGEILVSMAVEKVANPVVDILWHLQLRELGHQCRVPDREVPLRTFVLSSTLQMLALID